MAILYDDLETYDRYKKDFKRFEYVEVLKTKYSIKINYGKKKIFLTKDNDNQGTNILGLINKVKNDVTKFIDGQEITTTKSNDIFWYYYNELCGKDGQTFEVAKIDLTSAYWTKAINRGIISKETVDYFKGLEFADVKERKSARLKALGSLATVKSTEIYRKGIRQAEYIPLIMNENFRSVYMGICNEVAKDMQTVLGRVNGVYYYWDCIFIIPDSIDEVGKIFKDMGYKFTVEKDTAEVFHSKDISYLYCMKTGIKYPIN